MKLYPPPSIVNSNGVDFRGASKTRDTERGFYLFLLLLLLILLPPPPLLAIAILRFSIQLERIPDSGSLDLVRSAEPVRDRVDRGLYGSINDHRRCGIEGRRRRCGSPGWGGGDIIRWQDEGISRGHGEDGGGGESTCAQHVVREGCGS